MDQCFNVMLSGPSGVSKTMIAAGLCYDALTRGYKAYFQGMESILTMLRVKDLAASAGKEYKRLRDAQLIVTDDLMNFSFEKKEDGNHFFSFINDIYESTSFIITTNRSPAQWDGTLDDNVLATALLDRLLYKYQLIQLKPGYKMENRETIF